MNLTREQILDFLGQHKQEMHDRFGVNNEIVWDIVQNKPPLLQKRMEEIINLELSGDKGRW
jgi:uncharacterized protein with HEPN domain